MEYPQPPREIADVFRKGGVIPAHPVALTSELTLDEQHQRALSRYYIDAGSIGLAVGVNPSGLRLHDPKGGLLEPVLELAMETARDWKKDQLLVMIAGITGKTQQAVKEAELARGLGYHIGLLSLAALRDASEERLLTHCRKVAETIPLMGYYLQPDQGGAFLSEEFWRKLSEIPNVVGIRVAPFDRYQMLCAVAGVARSGRVRDVALYTGNEDTFVADLLTPYVVDADGAKVRKEIVGGLLGHWSFWTKRAVEIHRETKKPEHENRVPRSLFTLAAQVTEASEAVSDPHNAYAGWVTGILHVLARSGLVAGTGSIDAAEKLSPGQAERIERVIRAYPGLTDDAFVSDHRDRWLAP
jgi:dihydrodipicolinate synthase/N-acetylneuraminate lyase